MSQVRFGFTVVLMPFLMLMLFVIWLYALVESITAEESAVRNLPKVAWVFIVLLAFPVGAIAWFFAGRPQRAQVPESGSRSRQTSPRPIGPEDSADFRRQVEDQKLLRKREEDLAKREEDLRRREDEGPTS